MFVERARYLAAKTRRAWSDRTLLPKLRWYLSEAFHVPWAVMVDYWFRMSPEDRRLSLREGIADHRERPDHHRPDPRLVRRLMAAFRAAKEAQPQAPDPYQIRGLWLEWANIHHKPLVDLILADDVEGVSRLLQNFNREAFTIGTGGGYDDYRMFRNSPLARFYLKSMWAGYRDRLLDLGFDLDRLHFPLVGNPFGIEVGGSVIQVETLRHAYKACEIAGLLRDVPDAVVVEIGGGLGGQAYQTIRLADPPLAKYLVFDLPEVAFVSSYFLAAALPDKRLRFFGEGPVSTSESEEYDIGVFPHFAIPALEDGSVDLFYNACSFSEMDGVQSSEYLRVVERCGRRYFMHVNHDTQFQVRNPDGTISLSNTGSQLVPDPHRYKRVYKHPRALGRPEDHSLRCFVYLYERVRPVGAVEEGESPKAAASGAQAIGDWQLAVGSGQWTALEGATFEG